MVAIAKQLNPMKKLCKRASDGQRRRLRMMWYYLAMASVHVAIFAWFNPTILQYGLPIFIFGMFTFFAGFWYGRWRETKVLLCAVDAFHAEQVKEFEKVRPMFEFAFAEIQKFEAEQATKQGGL